MLFLHVTKDIFSSLRLKVASYSWHCVDVFQSCEFVFTLS